MVFLPLESQSLMKIKQTKLVIQAYKMKFQTMPLWPIIKMCRILASALFHLIPTIPPKVVVLHPWKMKKLSSSLWKPRSDRAELSAPVSLICGFSVQVFQREGDAEPGSQLSSRRLRGIHGQFKEMMNIYFRQHFKFHHSVHMSPGLSYFITESLYLVYQLHAFSH